MLRRLFCLLSVSLVIFTGMYGVLSPYPAIALSDCQKEIFDSSIYYYNCNDEEDVCKETAASAAGGVDATGDYTIRLPAISDGEKLAQAIDQYIKQKQPNSPFNGLGKYFVQGGIRAGINPLLVVAHAEHESQFGTATTKYNSQGAHNAFGRTASKDQPGVDTGRKWYKWDSWQASLYAASYPASGKAEQPDDQFQYIARKYGNNLDYGLEAYLQGNTASGRSGYAPKEDGNNVPAYVQAIKDTTNAIVALAGGAIDTGKIGTPTANQEASSPAQIDPVVNKVPVIALDPGHGGEVREYIDPETGLGDRETANQPESNDVQDVANRVKAALELAGYKVVMLKTNATDAVSKRQRVDAAKAANANLAVSIHTDSGSGTFENWGEVWPQFVGGYRASSTDLSKKVEFTNEEVANLSDSYADLFAAARDKSERGGSGKTKKVVGQAVSFAKSRGLPTFGDLSLVQLWADSIPWVYNEAGAPSGGLNDTQKSEYAQGIIDGVKAAIPNTGATNATQTACLLSATSAPQGNGDAIATALLYAWPNYRGNKTKEALTMKPEYANAVTAARKRGLYIGGSSYPGVDCGGFVTRVMLDSGYEPNYNKAGKGGYTAIQLAWARQNWQKIGRGTDIKSADALQPGDVAFRVSSNGSNDGHTFMYVGKQAGFSSAIASASLDSRAPMAGKEQPLAANIEWYRKKDAPIKQPTQ